MNEEIEQLANEVKCLQAIRKNRIMKLLKNYIKHNLN